MNIAILAPGGIAKTMAKTLQNMEEVTCYAVASRELAKAETFKEQWGFDKAYGSYEEMLQDPMVELVYVCTPHSLHYKYAKLCLEYGKNVLVEKPFTVNSAQAEALIQIAGKKNVFITEAMWTRYMPSREMIDEILASGIIGKVNFISANLGYPLAGVERMEKPELAGGALLDLGVYTIHFARMICKEDVVKISSDAVMSPSGVDLVNQVTLTFKNNVIAVLSSSMLSATNRMGLVCGDKGYLEVQNINNCEEIRIYDEKHQLVETRKPPKQITGFEYQVRACINSISRNCIACEELPHLEILRSMRVMDQVREQWGMRFPCE